MITWMRTADVHDGKLEEAFTWAVKVANYVNQKAPGSNVKVARNVGGPVFQVHWVAYYESLAAFEKTWKMIEADEGYQELLAEIRQMGALIGTSAVDAIYETVG